MFNFTLIQKKNFLSFLNKVNSLLVSIFNNLKFNNLKRVTKLFLIDKRVIITLIIVFFSLFVHLSTPAFYKDSWVKEIVKNQFEKEFKFEIEFSDKLNYAIFPIPHFIFRDVEFVSNGTNLAEIETIKVYLTFSKFLDKNKMNIQNVVVKKAKFKVYKKDIKNFVTFFNRKINEKKVTISNSQIFFKNKKNDIYSIVSIDKINSFYDNLDTINILNFDGKIFNNPFKLNIKKESNFNLELIELNKSFSNTINFTNKTKKGNFSYFDARKRHDTKYLLDNDVLKFFSKEKIDNNNIYSGIVNLSPFYGDLNIYLRNIELNKLFNSDSFLIEILKSNIFVSENLNFNIKIKSKNVLDHRKLKDLNLNINYENQILNFNQSNLLFDDILSFKIVDSELKNSKKNQYLLGELEIVINDYLNLYKLFQTKKEYRKKIDTIKLVVKYDFLKNRLSLEKLVVDKEYNENIQIILNQFNQANNSLINRVDLKNLFNLIAEEL